MITYSVEYTDTFGGEANYSWVRREIVTMPELTHFGYDGGTNYCQSNKRFTKELMRRAKAKVGLTNVRGRRFDHGDLIEFRPYRSCTVMFISASED